MKHVAIAVLPVSIAYLHCEKWLLVHILRALRPRWRDVAVEWFVQGLDHRQLALGDGPIPRPMRKVHRREDLGRVPGWVVQRWIAENVI